MKKAYDYLIVGAGLFGAVFAHEMSGRGANCLVIDRRDHIGGNVFTEETEGICVHKYGAHIFHTSDEEVWKYVNQFAAFNHYINAPVAVFGDEVYNLPFNMNTFSRLWGVRTPAEAKKKIEEQVAAEGITEPKNLEEQALSLVGRDIYEKLIKGYTEKQWGRPCTELPAFIIRRLPLRFTYDNDYFNDRFQGIPIGGYTPMIEQMLAGTEVRTGVDFAALRESGEISADKILYTGRIDEYYQERFGALEFRSLRFETEIMEEENFQGNAVVNYTARKVPWTRIIEHKHFDFGTQRKTVITREYPAAWEAGMEPYYPVNDERNSRLYEQYAALAAQEERVIFGGRLGEYKYYDMDKVIAAALAKAAAEMGE